MKKIFELDIEKLNIAVDYFRTMLVPDWPGGEELRELIGVVAQIRNEGILDNSLSAAIELSHCWDRIKYMKLAQGDDTPMTDETWLQSIGISWRD